MKQPSFNITYKTGILFLLLIAGASSATAETYEYTEAFASQAALPDNTLPSDQALGNIQNQTTPTTRDWWDEGPPIEGGGSGSYVSAPISKGKAAVPVTVASLIYLMICFKKKKNSSSN